MKLIIFIFATIAPVLVLSLKPESLFNLEQYVSTLINKKIIPPNYNRHLRPNFGNHEPVLVNISLFINDITSINEAPSSSIELNLYLHHHWSDSRLNFSIQHNIREVVVVGEEIAKKIWLPSTYFMNAQSLAIQKTATDEEASVLTIAANGDVTYSTKLSMLTKCALDLAYFPFDNTKCSIELAIYGKPMDEVIYKWLNDTSNAVTFNTEQITLPAFHIVGYSTTSLDRLKLDIFLSRYIGAYISQIYLPASLTVIISWVPFWLDSCDSNSRLFRLVLGVLSLLIITIVAQTNLDSLKAISQLTALDIYLVVCLLLVFTSVLETAIVSYCEMKPITDSTKAPLANSNESSNLMNQSAKGKTSKATRKLDQISRRLFPLLFALFNLIYFTVLYFIRLASRHMEIDVAF